MNDERPRDYRNSYHGHPPELGPDDLEVLLFGGDGPELTCAQAERNTELLTALTTAARDCGVVPTFLQLPAAPPAPAVPPAPAGSPSGLPALPALPAGGPDAPPFEEAYCLRMGVRTRRGFPLGRIDFLNAVLRLAAAYQLGMYIGETAGAGSQPHYRQVRPHRQAPDPDARPDAPRRPEPPPRARHRVIDLTAPVPVPPRTPLDGSLMLTVVGPVDSNLAADLARIAVFFDDHRVGCHAASASLLERTIVVNFVLVVLPDAPVRTAAFAEILSSGLDSDPVWPGPFRPTLLDPVPTR